MKCAFESIFSERIAMFFGRIAMCSPKKRVFFCGHVKLIYDEYMKRLIYYLLSFITMKKKLLSHRRHVPDACSAWCQTKVDAVYSDL